jgi:protocatechuate 3,4-dioxygenase beta subunit
LLAIVRQLRETPQREDTMDSSEARTVNRRQLLRLGLALPVPFVVAACSDGGGDGDRSPTAAEGDGDPTTAPTRAATADTPPTHTAAATLSPTPACGDDDEPTVAQTEGPFFTPDSPERTSLLEPGINGTALLVTGRVLSTGCEPVERALVDFWQCDDAGEYDNTGYRLRGHQFTDGSGAYRLETIVPGTYPGRTRHIHVKVQAPGRPVLTTQLYFPDEPGNATDRIFDDRLVMELRDASGGKEGAFDFVLDLS